MTQADLAKFRAVLRTKQAELTTIRGLENIAIERSADVLEESDYKTARELAIAGLHRDSTVRRSVASSLLHTQDGSFGTCIAIATLAGGAWRRCRGPRCASAVRRRLTVAKKVFLRVLSRDSSTLLSRPRQDLRATYICIGGEEPSSRSLGLE
jgi:hypothetical protein